MPAGTLILNLNEVLPMAQGTRSDILDLLQQMKTAAKNREVDRLSDEMAALVRETAIPVLEPTIRWAGNTMVVA